MPVRLAHLVLPVLLLLAPGVTGAAKRDEAEETYQQARRAYYALKDDAARRKLRHHWLNVAEKFESVASHFPKSPRAPDALFTAGELLQELSRVSFMDDDLKAAIADYTKLLEAHPKHRLADDAALALARIHVHRLDKPEAARRVLTEALATNPKSDQSRELKELLASLPAVKTAPAAAPSRAKSGPAVAAKDTAAGAEPSPAERSALVDAITKLAREPSPLIPRQDPNAPAQAEAGDKAPALASAADGKAAKDSAESAVPAKEGKAKEPAVASAPAKDVKPAEPRDGRDPAHAVASAPKDTRDAKPVAEKDSKADVKSGAEAVAARSGKADAKETPPTPTKPAVEAPAVAASKAGAKAEDEGTKKGSAEPAQVARAVTAPVDDQVAQARLKAVAKQSRSAELTLAEQLGLKVRRVVLDPGHGGHDTGAIGKAGTREKDVALAISKKLATELRERGLEVLLTRDDDRFIRLEDRAKFANEAHGDLFISVHCNSAVQRKLRGIETYTLNTSADRYSIRLAARENASSEKGISDLQFILADLATKANTEESSRLSAQVQKSLVSNLSRKYDGIKSLGSKEALFYVLLGAKMPAILVETSFLSNPEEEERLTSEGYQDEVAEAIAHGVEEFLGDRSRVAKVD